MGNGASGGSAWMLHNAPPEWRGTNDVEMQTGRAILRPLQAAGSAVSVVQAGGGICLRRKS